MDAILNLVSKDLRRRRRQPLGTLILLLFPLVYAGLLALAFGGDGQATPTVRLLISDLDEGFLGDLVVGAFANGEASNYFQVEQVSEEEGRARMEEGEASALLILPRDLTRALLTSGGAENPQQPIEIPAQEQPSIPVPREPVVLQLVRNPAQSILPQIGEEVSLILAEVLGAGSYILAEPLRALEPFITSEEVPTEATVAAVAVGVHRLVQGGSPYLTPPVITLETSSLEAETEAGGGASSSSPSIFLFLLPGITMFSLFMIGELTMRDLVTELKQGTLQRQLAGPLTLATVVLGKVATTAVVAAGCLAVIGAVALLQGASPSPFAAFVLSVAVILAVTGTVTLLYGLTPDEARAASAGSVIFLLMAFVGGSFIPLNNLPPVMRQLSPMSPFFWGTDGYLSLLSGEGMLAVVPNIVVLTLIGLITLGLGIALLYRRLRTGLAV